MSDVKRYHAYRNEMREDDFGGFVKLADYDDAMKRLADEQTKRKLAEDGLSALVGDTMADKERAMLLLRRADDNAEAMRSYAEQFKRGFLLLRGAIDAFKTQHQGRDRYPTEWYEMLAAYDDTADIAEAATNPEGENVVDAGSATARPAVGDTRACAAPATGTDVTAGETAPIRSTALSIQPSPISNAAPTKETP